MSHATPMSAAPALVMPFPSISATVPPVRQQRPRKYMNARYQPRFMRSEGSSSIPRTLVNRGRYGQ